MHTVLIYCVVRISNTYLNTIRSSAVSHLTDAANDFGE